MSLKTILEKYPQSETYLIEILLEYQNSKNEHFISEEEIKVIAQHLSVTESKVCSVISFYTLFSRVPRGRYIIRICKDIPCFLNSQTSILNALESLLGIHVGETTENKLFTLEYTSCLGCCNKAPAMLINGTTYTNLTENKVKTIISDYKGRQL